MRFETKVIDDVKIITLTGQIRISTQNEFKQLLDLLVDENAHQTVILNMDGVIFINSIGLRGIIDTYKKFRGSKGRLVLCCLMPEMLKLILETRIHRFIEIFETEEEALSKIKN